MKGYEAGNLIRYFKDAGFRTYWLSNQYYLGEHDNLYSAIAFRSDEPIFLNNISSIFLETISYDEDLLVYFNNIINSNDFENKLIIIHLIGSYAPFEMRYPKKFGSFNYNIGKKDILGGVSKQKYIATYDNSIEYTDSILKSIIIELDKKDDESFLIFLSDHGADVYDVKPDKIFSRNWSNAAFAPSLYQIPMFIWLSENYKKSHANITLRVKNSTNRKYQTDRIIHTILDLSGLSDDKYYCDEDSVISAGYKEKKRIVHGFEID